MKDIFIIRQGGAYWQEILEVHEGKEKAIERCKYLSENDIDTYHSWVVSKITIGSEISELNVSYGEAARPNETEEQVFILRE